MRDLGEMGESIFKYWCSSVGLIANGSKIDKTGWDFLVEFPFSSDTSIPQDMQPAPFVCKVQIKATDNRQKNNRITVSNLRHFIRAQMPSFYCFIEFNGKSTPQSAYLVHVGKEFIENVLKRIRELEADGKADKLNKDEMPIPYLEEHRLNELTGACLKAKIESYIPNGIEEYINWKNTLLNTLGFEDGLGQATFTVSEENSIEKMVDFTLGIGNGLNVSNFEFRHQRFGILSDEPFEKGYEGKISSEIKPIMKAHITFKEYEHSPEISFQCNFYNSSLNDTAPQKYIKFRLETNFFDLVFQPYNRLINFSFSFDSELEYPILELNNFLKLLALLGKSKDELIIDVRLEDSSAFSTRIQANKTIEDYSDLCQVCEEAVTLCRDFSIVDKAKVSIDSLVKYAIHTRQMHQALHESPEVKIEFESEEVFKENMNIACVLLVDTIIGEHLISCFVAFVGEPKLLPSNKRCLIPNERVIGPKFVSKQDTVLEQEKIDECYNVFCDELENMNITNILKFE